MHDKPISEFLDNPREAFRTNNKLVIFKFYV